jgi:hypothetical protein
MSDAPGLAASIDAVVFALGAAGSARIHRGELQLARLLLDRSPHAAALQLELVERHLAGEVVTEGLNEARQDCWSYVGAIACGCTPAESAAAQAVFACLVDDASAHNATSLAEQVERVRRCGVSGERILAVLQAV